MILELLYLHRNSDRQLSPVAFQADSPISKDSIYNPLGGDILDFRRRMTEFGPRQYLDQITMLQIVVGINGKIPKSLGVLDDWTWEISHNYGVTDSVNGTQGGLDRPHVADALGHARNGAGRAGRILDGFRSCALTNVALLEPGEPVDSPRVVRTVGPNVMASVYYFYDEVQERGIEPPEFLRPIWKRYCALVEDTPAEYRHFRTHEFHYTYLHPGEVELIDAGLIRATCLVGTAEALVEQVRELERQGLQELMFAIGVDEKWRVAEAFARGVIARM